MNKRYYIDEDDNDDLEQNNDSNKFIDSQNLFDKHDYEDDDTIINDDDDDDDLPEQIIEHKEKKIIKPKLIGKHSLAYDTIFKGQKNINTDINDAEHIINMSNSLDMDNSIEYEESRNNIDYYRETRLKAEIRKLLENNTDIDFLAPRRKPARTDFNVYFANTIKELYNFGYTKTEIFIELSGYFSDNIWNMFQLLDKQYANIVIQELKDKYGLHNMDYINFLT